jgi:ketosteroid isomerase-like protein
MKHGGYARAHHDVQHDRTEDAMSTIVSGDIDARNLEQLNAGFIDAVQASDTAWFEEHLAADFLISGADGALLDRRGFIAHIAKPPGITGLRSSDVRIRVFGDFAVIHGRTAYAKADGTAAGGRYLDVYALTRGQWKVVAAHVTRG